nr:hypothetical protein [Tanacetum cinerariifolium]
MRHGFDLGYKTWVHYDEPDLPPLPPLIDNTRQAQMSDMTAVLNDLSYIPPNNEHNETSNELTQATRNEFEELYASANEELYPGCDYVTRLDFMAKFTYFTVKGKLTDSIFNEMLKFFQNVFPISNGYKLPPSYYAIKKTFKMIGLGYESIHACEHDCCLFRGDDNKDLDFCLVCNTSRWKDSNTSGKKVPKKVLRYFLIIPRLQRLYKSSHTAKEMIWHATGKCMDPGKMQHSVDGRAWKNFDTNDIDNIQSSSVVMYESSFMLTLLIPGPKSLGKDIDFYLVPLIEDIKLDRWPTYLMGKHPTYGDLPLYYPSWLKVPKERNEALITDIRRQSSATQEYPSLIGTFFVTHTVNGEEMRNLEATGTYTDDEINRLARRGKQRGHITSVARVKERSRKGQNQIKTGQKREAWRSREMSEAVTTQFDLRPHMESLDWTEIDASIQQHLQKARARLEAITAKEWDKYIQFWNDPRNIARATQNRQNRAKSMVISRQGSRSPARLRDKMRQSSATQEYPSLIDTFFVAHTVNGVFTQDEDSLIYFESAGASGSGRSGVSGGCGDDEESADDQEDEDGDGDS